MGKSAKKSGTKVDAAPAAFTKPLKKGKREAEETSEKKTDAKKQKKDIEEAIQKEKAEAKVPATMGAAPAKKLPLAASENGVAKNVEDSSRSDESTRSDDGVPYDEVPESKATATKNGPVAGNKKNNESSDDLDADDDTSSGADAPAANEPASAAKKEPAAAVGNGKLSDGLNDETNSDNDVTIAKKSAALPENGPAAAATKDDSGDESDSEDKTNSGEDVTAAAKEVFTAASKKKDESNSDSETEEDTAESEDETDVDKVDAKPHKTNASPLSEEKAPKTPLTSDLQASGSKTLFVGNLPFSAEQADVKEFFKDTGEITEVRFALRPDGSFRGFGHVEFATAEAAQKALRLNGQQLSGRDLKIDLAVERGSHTPQTGKDRSSHQKGGRGQGQTIFVQGFGTNDYEEKIRDALKEHFRSCGEIKRVSIPKDRDGGFKGVAFVEFVSSNSLNQALKLDNSELAGSTLTVEEAKLRGEARDGADGGRFGGGRGGRFGGSRGGGRGGRHGGGGSGRGRGTPNKPSIT